MKISESFFRSLTISVILAILLAIPNLVFAGSPLFSLDTFDDWSQAPISPVFDDYEAANEVYRNIYGLEYEYRIPELYVYDGNPGFDPPLDDAGLVMVWGDAPTSVMPQLAAWEYVYPVDPSLIGTTLRVTVTPPAGIWAVSLTLNDAAGNWNTWDWWVATPGNPIPLNSGAIPILPNAATTITLDPTLAANQSGSNVFVPNGFNPAIATTIQADELSAGGGILFPPNPITGTPQAWNYWSNLSITGIPLCGDGNLDPGETCDDGNNQSGDGCSATCQLEVCGDGYMDPGEECDDGNNIPGDGCSEFCTVEYAVNVLSCDGFGPPMDNGSVMVKKNRVLPLKAYLFDNGTMITELDITVLPVLQVIYNSGVNGTPVDVTDQALTAGQGTNGNIFEFIDGMKLQLNLKIKNYTASGTYILYMVSGDDTEYIIDPTCVAEFVIN